MSEFLLANVVNRTVGSTTAQAEKVSNSEFVQTVLTSLDVFKNVVISIGIVLVFYIIGKLIARRIVKTLREAKGESLYPDMVILINRFAVYGSVFVGLAVVIQFIFQLDFIQVIGFFGLGISFAFKDLLANLIAGAVIILQNRFRIGDFIQVGVGQNGIKGKIMEIQTRATILKAIDGTEIIIPNAELITSPVVSYTAHHTRRIDFTIGISFDADLDKARQVAYDTVKQNEYVLQKPDPQILVQNIGESSVDLSVRFWIDPQSKEQSWIITRSELVGEVKKAFDREGIEIPFPIRTLRGSAVGTGREEEATPSVLAEPDPQPDNDEDPQNDIPPQELADTPAPA